MKYVVVFALLLTACATTAPRAVPTQLVAHEYQCQVFDEKGVYVDAIVTAKSLKDAFKQMRELLKQVKTYQRVPEGVAIKCQD